MQEIAPHNRTPQSDPTFHFSLHTQTHTHKHSHVYSYVAEEIRAFHTHIQKHTHRQTYTHIHIETQRQATEKKEVTITGWHRYQWPSLSWIFVYFGFQMYNNIVLLVCGLFSHNFLFVDIIYGDLFLYPPFFLPSPPLDQDLGVVGQFSPRSFSCLKHHFLRCCIVCVCMCVCK